MNTLERELAIENERVSANHVDFCARRRRCHNRAGRVAKTEVRRGHTIHKCWRIVAPFKAVVGDHARDFANVDRSLCSDSASTEVLSPFDIDIRAGKSERRSRRGYGTRRTPRSTRGDRWPHS